MSLLSRIVYAAAATRTHRRLALDALAQLHGPDMRDWERLFLKHHEVYLSGMTVDYVRQSLKEGFEFTNPNERDRCGCGESFRV